MEYAPILLFAYNRPEHFRRTLDALKTNELASESDLFIYSDGARPGDEEQVCEVRRIARQTSGFQSVFVVERSKNMGLASNIIDAVTDIINRCGKVIVLEDDLITSPYFLRFMNDGLTVYQNNPEVMNVQAHVLYTKNVLPETFFIHFINSWGWGTWKRAWDMFEADGTKLLNQLQARSLTHRFDFDGKYPFTRMLQRQIEGKNNSWAIRWNASVFLCGGLSLNAGRSLVKNIGTDGSGTNFTREAGYFTVLDVDKPVKIDPDNPVEENEEARKAIGKVYAYEYSKITKGIRLLRSLVRRFF